MIQQAKQSLGDIVEQKIQQDFFEQDEHHAFLPTERELCEQYGVSRITIREALRGLETRGYVRRLQGKGIECVDESSAVVSRSIQTLITRSGLDHHHLLEVRFMLERQAVRYAAIRADARDIARLQDSLKQMLDKRASYDEYLSSDMQFHIYLGMASKNALLSSLIQALVTPLRSCIEQYTDKQMRLEPSYRFHAKILEAVMTKDAEEAEKQMMRHLITTETLIENRYQQLPYA